MSASSWVKGMGEIRSQVMGFWSHRASEAQVGL